MILNKAVLISILLLSSFSYCNIAQAVQTETRLEREGPSLFKRSEGSRINREKLRNCKTCDDKENKLKARYLERILLNSQSSEYQLILEQALFGDAEFLEGCWNNHLTGDLEVFFSVTKKGRAKDIAWFPKAKKANCVNKHIKKLKFPTPVKTHHAWFLLEVNDSQK